MKHLAPHRRAVLARAAACALGGFVALRALAFEAAPDKVLLTISGAIAKPNDRGAASFDLALLRTLPQHSFTTKTPWYAEPRKFSGVPLRDLLLAVGAPPGASLNAVALNDYRVEIPSADIVQHGALLAYLLDDQPMSVRQKGPLVIIYPFDDRPELRTAVHFSRAIWQLRSLEVKVQ